MLDFTHWLYLTESLDPQQVINAAILGRKNGGICDRAHFGDCQDIMKETMVVLRRAGIQAYESGGTFITNLANNDSWEHSWVQVGKHILDPTVDQFFSDLDVDMHTKTPGIYYSNPQWDGNELRNRYQRTSGTKIKL